MGVGGHLATAWTLGVTMLGMTPDGIEQFSSSFNPISGIINRSGDEVRRMQRR